MKKIEMRKMNFNELNIDNSIIKNLDKIGFEKPTQIQELVIDLANQDKNILGCAQTGTGKTAAFGVSLINKILKNKKENQKRKLTSLILVPTRELAIQVNENIKAFSENLGIKSLAIYGGMRNRETHFQIFRKGLDIVVATPGRLLDYLRGREINLSNVETVVIDEADLMVDMGFIDDVREILVKTKEQKQIMLFSATMPKAIMSLVESFMGDFETVKTQSFAKPLENIEHIAYFYGQDKPVDLLKILIKNENIFSAIVFVRTKRDADAIEKILARLKMKTDSLHGDKSQAKRSRIIKDFKNGKIQILIATDVASRGLDVEDISHVFNFNIPEDPEIYTHRVGRTGRAKKEGKAISFFNRKDFYFLSKIEKEIQMEIPKHQIDVKDNEIKLSNFDFDINVQKEKKSRRQRGKKTNDKSFASKKNYKDRNYSTPDRKHHKSEKVFKDFENKKRFDSPRSKVNFKGRSKTNKFRSSSSKKV